ncbi:MAG: MBL fold metallo-hydrolase [Proteobacteria bacterium]|nr:MBL fold metallo-hydrolase [Pseudomonadota bacterium]
MKLWSIEGNRQRLDGGAMFGNCPKAVWQRWCAPDADNRIELACRALLVQEDGGRHVLLETGIGAFFEPKLRARFGVCEERHVLLERLAAIGLGPAEIDVVVLSHLHFDHAGGLLSAWQQGRSPTLVFPRARFVVGLQAWRRQQHPHPRDRASFIAELGPLLEHSGRLDLVDGTSSKTLGPSYSLSFSDGHTPGLMLTRIAGAPPGPMTFVGDLIPGVPWLHLPITMGYDRFPERLIDEKQALLQRVVRQGEWLFFTHDPSAAACRPALDARGRYIAAESRSELGPLGSVRE